MKLNYLLITNLIFVLLLSSCFEDETTEATEPISEIEIIESSIDSIYNIDKNETLTITPQVVQTNKQKPLSITWEIELKEYSHEESFVFTGNELGTFNCRFIVENEDGKTFFPFKINVNSPYEEGITIVSKDPEGKSMLSFLLNPVDSEVKPEFSEGDCFALNNPEYAFASNVVDMVQCQGSLLIACRGKEGDSEDVPTIYYLNDKTFTVENVITVPEYPDFKPLCMGIPSSAFSGSAYPIICDGGKAFSFSVTEAAISASSNLHSTYAPKFVVQDENGPYYDIVFWDKEVGALASIYAGYGPYYCSKNYHATRNDMSKEGYNYFSGRQFVNMTLIRKTKDQLAIEEPEMLVVTKNNVLYQKTVLCSYFWVYDYNNAETVLYDNGGSQMCGMGNAEFNENSPCIANKTYYSLLFGSGNKVMRWNYMSSQFLTQADELLRVPEKAIITGFEISADHKLTYVAFYEPEKGGLNGSVWIFNTDTGEVVEEYNNVCYQPIKIMYKKK